jgi:Coenzyme PQQ synthesis protein D (PqqD)
VRRVFPVRSGGWLCPKTESKFAVDPSLSLESVVVAATSQVSCSLGDESAILNMKNTVYYGLDPVGTRVWALLRQPRTIREMCDVIVDEYDVERPRCERDILELLEAMKAEGLVELSNTASTER